MVPVGHPSFRQAFRPARTFDPDRYGGRAASHLPAKPARDPGPDRTRPARLVPVYSPNHHGARDDDP